MTSISPAGRRSPTGDGEDLHAIAERVSAGELDAGPDVEGLALLMEQVDAVWSRLEFRTPWSRAREHERIQVALARFLRWHHDNRRRLVGTESRFTTEVVLPDGERVRLVGYADRVELDHDGRVVVVDLKTGRSAPSQTSVQSHLQLGLYQYAVDRGALDQVVHGLRSVEEHEAPQVQTGWGERHGHLGSLLS